MSTPDSPRPVRLLLGSPEMRRLVERTVRKRVPPAEVDDVVQTVLCDALAAEQPPDTEEQLRKWLVGITRHKVADFHRRGRRAELLDRPDKLPAPASGLEAREWASWAARQAEGKPDDERTLGWMAREGGGDKLAHIAEDERLPATQVRQRVSRLRRIMRQRWLAELAAVAGVGVAVLVAWYLLREPEQAVAPIGPDVIPSVAPTAAPLDPAVLRARELRAEGLRQCDDHAWQPCLDALDEAARLDPAGDADERVERARRIASVALRPPVPAPSAPAPSAPDPVATAQPSASVLPAPTPRPPTTAAPPSSEKELPLRKKPAPTPQQQESTPPALKK